MLVVSRKLKEKLLFPAINAAIQVLEIKQGVVRLGIDAPPEVTVVRDDVANRQADGPHRKTNPDEVRTAAPGRAELARQLRERLKTTGVGLGLARLQLEAGRFEEARKTLAALEDDFQLLLYGVDGETDSPVPGRPAAEARKPRRALLVEDDRDERELLAGFLRRSGLEVDTAGDGADALDRLRSRGKPDVLLLDMGLSRVDGPAVVRELRHDPAYRGLKIIAVTAHAPDEFDLQRGPAGVDRWCRKPFDPGALLHELQQELRNA
jgi:carbon storage regulator CsrA